MNNNTKLGLIIVVAIGLAIGFVFMGSGFDFDHVIPKRLLRLATIILGGICVAFSSIIFQTLVGNRILTPSIMGYEAVYLLWQVMLLFLMGTHTLSWFGVEGHFFVSILVMLLYSWLIHRYLLTREQMDVFQLLLIGLVLTMVMGTATQFVQLKISPGEFSVFQALSYASFNRVQPTTLIYATLIVLVIFLLLRKRLATLDVLVLGREQAISLGIDHHRAMQFYLALIALLLAISTSLIGSTAFMGVFIANTAYALVGNLKHKFSLAVGCVIAISIFLVAQILVEHVFNYKTTVSILVNLVCGIYFLTLMLRARGLT